MYMYYIHINVHVHWIENVFVIVGRDKSSEIPCYLLVTHFVGSVSLSIPMWTRWSFFFPFWFAMQCPSFSQVWILLVRFIAESWVSDRVSPPAVISPAVVCAWTERPPKAPPQSQLHTSIRCGKSPRCIQVGRTLLRESIRGPLMQLNTPFGLLSVTHIHVSVFVSPRFTYYTSTPLTREASSEISKSLSESSIWVRKVRRVGSRRNDFSSYIWTVTGVLLTTWIHCCKRLSLKQK